MLQNLENDNSIYNDNTRKQTKQTKTMKLMKQ